jgi:hypothetical protein
MEEEHSPLLKEAERFASMPAVVGFVPTEAKALPVAVPRAEEWWAGRRAAPCQDHIERFR